MLQQSPTLGNSSFDKLSLSMEEQKSIFSQQAQNTQEKRSIQSHSGTSKQLQVMDSLENELKQVPEEKKLSLVLHLMNKYFSNNEATQYLCDYLNQHNDSLIEPYYLELVYFLIKHDSKPLENFLLERSSNSISTYLRIKWIFQAFTGNDRKDPKKNTRIELLDQKIEEAMVNSSSEQSQTEQNVFVYLDKEHRSNYGDSIHLFINNLIKISLLMKTVPEEERSQQLRKYLIKANRALVSYRFQNPDVIYCQGITIPFSSGCEKGSGQNSNMVVRIIESESQCFKTKTRVPYKILVETIDMQELKKQSPKIRKECSECDQKPLQEEECSLQALNETQTISQQQIDDFLENSAKDKLAIKEIIMQNSRRFNLIFPPQVIKRRQSCHPRVQTQKTKDAKSKQSQSMHIHHNPPFTQNKYNGYKFKHNRKRDLTPKMRVKFFKWLKKSHPEKKETIMMIFQKLNYHEVEQRLHSEKQRQLELEEQQKKYSICINGNQLAFQESWDDKTEKIRALSPYGHFQSYRLRPLIIKGGDDLRQELMVMQLFKMCQRIFEEDGTNLYMRTYDIIVTSKDSGILEFCTETISVDGLKKKLSHIKGLNLIYKEIFKDCFEEAQKCFIDSLAAYSVIQHLFQIKDRHNGNILVDSKGHLIHIDFGFILSIAPGGINFENVPFKLTKEYIDLMDGKSSEMFLYFKQRLYSGFSSLRKHVEEFVNVLQTMKNESDLPCFEKFDFKIFRDRFVEDSSEDELMIQVEKLVQLSAENSRTTLYDSFQKLTNGIMP